MDKYPKYISQEQQELFESYLLNELDKGEQLAFLARLDTNASLKEEFDEFNKLFSAVEEAGIRERMNQYHKTFGSNSSKETTTKKGFPFRINYGIAASVVLLLALGSIWYFNAQDKTEKLFDEFYSPDPGLPTVMGNTNDYDFYEAMVAYKHGDYDQAIEKWEKLLETEQRNDTLNYFLASAQMARGEEEAAKVGFSKVIAMKGSVFADDAYFYLGLEALKRGAIPEAKKFLELSKKEAGKELLNQLPK
jgi:tetratricopeptide (TPR) repeat protein